MDCKPRTERSRTKDFIVISFWTSFFFQVAGNCGKAAIQKDKLGRILEFWENIRILEEYPRILEVWENIRNWENIRVLGEWRYHGGFNCAQNNATTAYNYWYEIEVKTYKNGQCQDFLLQDDKTLILQFYPSISEDLLTKVISRARQYPGGTLEVSLEEPFKETR